MPHPGPLHNALLKPNSLPCLAIQSRNNTANLQLGIVMSSHGVICRRLIPDPLASILGNDVCNALSATQLDDSHAQQRLTPSIDDSRYPAQDRQCDADPESGTTPNFGKRSDWWKNDTEKVEEHVTAS